jgi:hypothetical protein
MPRRRPDRDSRTCRWLIEPSGFTGAWDFFEDDEERESRGM